MTMRSTGRDQRPLWNPSEWWEDLVWPRVFGSCVYGLRVDRVLLAFFALVVGGLVLRMGAAVDRAMLGDRPGVAALAMEGTPEGLAAAWRAGVGWPLALVSAYPIATLLAGPVALVIGLLALGAISRGAAVELAQGRRLGWMECLKYAAGRWRSLLGAALGPWLVWIGVSVLIAAGALVLRLPGLHVVAGLAYGVALVAGIAAVLLIVGIAIGQMLLVPAVACDGADALDAIQRALAYVFGHPIRLLVYLLAGLVGAVLLVGVVALVVRLGIGFSARSVELLGGARGTETVWRGTLEAMGLGATRGTVEGVEPLGATTWLVRFWVGLAVMGVASAGVSCVMASLTGVYLGIRRAADGQDMAEVFEEGQIERTMQQAMAGRAAVAGAVSASGAGGAGAEDLIKADEG